MPADAQPSAFYSCHFSFTAHSLGSENTTVMDRRRDLIAVCFKTALAALSIMGAGNKMVSARYSF